MSFFKFFTFSEVLVLLLPKITISSLDPNDYRMVITYGKPLKYSTVTMYPLSFKECVQKCWNDSSCVLVYDISPNCDIFRLNGITSVQKLNSSSNSRIAFRAYSPGSSCPDPSKNPILMGGRVTGRTVYKNENILPTYQEFNLTLNTKTSIWSFTSSVYYLCPPSGTPTKRGNTVYCIFVVSAYACINKTQALSEISRMNGYSLMGIKNMGEYEGLLMVAKSLLITAPGNKTYSSLGFWIDGVRKSTCIYPVKTSTACNGTNEFQYSDKTAPNPVFKWVTGQPDGLQNKPPDSNCLYLRASDKGESGVDDIPCSYNTDSSLDLCLTGYIQGTPATANPVK